MFNKLQLLISRNIQLKELISYSFWSVIGTAVSKLLLLIIWIIVARILKPEIYGEFSIIRNTTLLFAEFVGFSLSIAATKFIAESLCNKAKLSVLISNLLFSCFVLGMLLMIIFLYYSDYISVSMMKAPHLSEYISITSAVLLVSTFNNCQMGILRGFGAFKLIAKLNFIQVIPAFPVFCFLTMYYGLLGAVWGYVFYNITLCVFSQYYIISMMKAEDIKLNLKINLKILKKIFIYVFPYFASVFIGYFGIWFNEVQLISASDDGFVQLGNYSAISIIQNTIISAIIVFCTPLVSLMSKYKSNNTLLMEKANYYMPTCIGVFLIIPLLVVPEIFSMAYGKVYSNKEMYNLVWIMIAYTPLIIFRQSIARSIAVYEKQVLYSFDSLIMAIVMTGGFYLYSKYGVIAMILSIGVSYLLSIVIFTPIYIKIKIIDKAILKNNFFIISNVLFLLSIPIYYIFDANIFLRIVILVVLYGIITLSCFKYIKKKYL